MKTQYRPLVCILFLAYLTTQADFGISVLPASSLSIGIQAVPLR